MDIQIYWQSIVMFFLGWCVLLGGFKLILVSYFKGHTINWKTICVFFLISLISTLLTGGFFQKTHSVKQENIVSEMQGLITTDESLLTDYLEEQPERVIKLKSTEEHSKELETLKEKNDLLVKQTEGNQ